jgi:UDP-GlcNAc3NAcA epimerase
LIKIVTIIGARPQFIKAAALSRLIRGPEYSDRITETLVHTGQHYDERMSDVFFREMNIPEPDINLEVGSGSHGRMTGLMLIGIEEVLMERRPDAVLIYGDTNSTLAGALAASKLHIPVGHVEAGLRSFNMRMPEEQNRILSDRVSKWLFCPTQTAVDNLAAEGITDSVHLTGDIMLDVSLYYQKELEHRRADGKSPLVGMDLPEKFALLTLHRAENTDSRERMTNIVEALNRSTGREFVFPVHPRTRKYLDLYGLEFAKHVHCIEPVGYLQMLDLEMHSDIILTDSGGVQKEAFFVGTPCITLRDETEWVETVETGWNRLVGADGKAIQEALSAPSVRRESAAPFGHGDASRKILRQIVGSH